MKPKKDLLIPIHSSSTYPNKESHPPTNPALEAVPKRLPSPMWLKSNAITNLAHDLQSSDPEIARAWLPRRFASPCSTLCPTRNSTQTAGRSQCGKMSHIGQRVVSPRSFCLGRVAKGLKVGLLSPPIEDGLMGGATTRREVAPGPYINYHARRVRLGAPFSPMGWR